MPRYVALFWETEGSVACRSATRIAQHYRKTADEWRCALSVPGLVVFVAGSTGPGSGVHVLARSGGIVLGTLFGKEAGEDIDEREAAQILATGGRWLLAHYWGSYVALLREGASSPFHVLRDPSGGTPCYRLKSSGCDVFFADFADVAWLAVPRGSINWRFITAFLLHDELRSRETGLEDVSEILAGERLTLNNDGDEHVMLWDPVEICGRGWVDDFHEAQRLLRTTTQTVIEAWGRWCPRILHQLSGGFDSAVVLGCAHRCGLVPSMMCVNRFNPRPREDERAFSRLAAAQAGVDLIECEWGAGGEGLESLRDVPLVPKPSVQMLSILESATVNEWVRRCHAQVQWTGQGGDQLFFQMKTDLGAADYLRAHGIGRGFVSAVKDSARLTRESYWAVVGKVFEHPWRAGAAALPAGKQYQVGVLATLVNRPTPVGALEVAPEVHPLIAQPLMELSLRIPTYLLLHGGRSRGLAREAFRDIVPAEICSRADKGGTTVHLATLLRRNLGFLREILLEGTLARERLIDRKRLEPYLLKGHPLRVGELSQLLACVTAEMWLLNLTAAMRSPRLGDRQGDEASKGARVSGVVSELELRSGG